MSGECDICGTWGCVESNHDANPPKNATYWKRMAKRWEASANAVHKSASDNAALANRYRGALEQIANSDPEKAYWIAIEALGNKANP